MKRFCSKLNKRGQWSEYKCKIRNSLATHVLQLMVSVFTIGRIANFVFNYLIKTEVQRMYLFYSIGFMGDLIDEFLGRAWPQSELWSHTKHTWGAIMCATKMERYYLNSECCQYSVVLMLNGQTIAEAKKRVFRQKSQSVFPKMRCPTVY